MKVMLKRLKKNKTTDKMEIVPLTLNLEDISCFYKKDSKYFVFLNNGWRYSLILNNEDYEKLIAIFERYNPKLRQEA